MKQFAYLTKEVCFILVVPFLFFACTTKSNLETQLAELRLQTDSLNYKLSAIDTSKATALFSESRELLDQLKQNADTLSFEEAEMLNGYFNNVNPLKELPAQTALLKANLDSIGVRLKKLSSDIDKQAGDRREYQKYILSESRELDSLRSHVLRLLDEQQKAIEASAQFKEPIGRFIRRFAVP